MEKRFGVKYFCIYGLYRVGVMYFRVLKMDGPFRPKGS